MAAKSQIHCKHGTDDTFFLIEHPVTVLN